MGVCEVCGSVYDRTFGVVAVDGSEHVVDSFECAIHASRRAAPIVAVP